MRRGGGRGGRSRGPGTQAGLDDSRVDGSAVPSSPGPGVVHGDRLMGHLRDGRDGQVTKAGRPIRHFQRTPVEEPRTIRLADLTPGRPRRSRCVTRSACGWTVRRPGPWPGAWSKSRCATTARPDADPDRMWMFQTRLRGRRGRGRVFLPVCDVLEQDWPEPDPRCGG